MWKFWFDTEAKIKSRQSLNPVLQGFSLFSLIHKEFKASGFTSIEMRERDLDNVDKY